MSTPIYDELKDKWLEAPKREAFEELQELYGVEIIRHEPLPPKRKFKLFGRNQGTNGTL